MKKNSEISEKWFTLFNWKNRLEKAPCREQFCIVAEIDDEFAVYEKVFESILDENELARSAQFQFQQDRQRFIASRVLLRIVASSSIKRPPGDVVFNNPPSSGAPPEINGEVALSLSRSGKYIACAANFSGPIGVDIEYKRDIKDLDSLIQASLGNKEHTYIHALPQRLQNNVFLAYWCSKEATLKAYGTGLSVEPENVQTELNTLHLPVSGIVSEGGKRSLFQLCGYKEFADMPVVVSLASLNLNSINLCSTTTSGLVSLLEQTS